MIHSDYSNRISDENMGEHFLSNSFRNICQKKIRNNYKIFILCVISTFVWGMLTHAYFFLNDSFSHDSLAEFNAEVFGNDWKIQLGRVFVPAYRFLFRGYITLPWLIGILGLFYICLAIFITIKIFNIRSKFLIVLLAGIYTTNITVISQIATYVNDFDSNMMALVLAVFSVYLWKNYERGFLYGIIPLCLTIGLYQAYISVAITLILLILIMQLLYGKTFETVFVKGIKSIGMILCAGALYFVAIKLICTLTGNYLETKSYNSLYTIFSMSVKDIIRTAISGYMLTCYKFLIVNSIYSKATDIIVHVAMIGISAIVILFRITRKEIKIKEKILILGLFVLLPFGMDAVNILTGGISHDLMHFAMWLVYLLILLIAWSAIEWCGKWKKWLLYGQQIVSVFLVFIMLWSNVRVGNTVYMKKDLEQKGTFSLFTRIVYTMENFTGYSAGQTPVVFVGKPTTTLNQLEGFEKVSTITGVYYWYVMSEGSPRFYQAYFDYVLQNPAVMADSETWSQMQSDNRVRSMPCYPTDGSIEMIDGCIVIKLGENTFNK